MGKVSPGVLSLCWILLSNKLPLIDDPTSLREV